MLLNKNPSIRLETIAGPDQLLIVDDFYADPYQVREIALKCHFSQQSPKIRSSRGGYYPGSLAAVQRSMPGADETLDRVRDLLRGAFAVEIQPSDVVSDFGVISVTPADLTPPMKHPHADVGNPFLGLVYLNPFIDSGTSFYRHRETGLYAARSEDQKRFVIDFAADPRNSARDQAYIMGSNRYWERIHSVGGVFNRFVAYAGHVIHSGDVFLPASSRLGEHRLTQRFLILEARNIAINAEHHATT